jgi:hypothetical protein
LPSPFSPSALRLSPSPSLEFSDYVEPNGHLGTNMSLVAISYRKMIQEITNRPLPALGNFDESEYTQIYTAYGLKQNMLFDP